MASGPDLRTNILLRSEQSGGHVSIMENVVARTAPDRPCTGTTSMRRSTCSKAS